MAAENARWALEHGEVNDCYFLYGLDQKHGPQASDFLSQREWMDTINRQIYESGAQEVTRLLKDKVAFAEFAAARGVPTPRNIAVLHRDHAEWFSPRQCVEYDKVLTRAEGVDGFCKPVGGQHGAGTFRFTVANGRAYVGTREIGVDALRARAAEPLLLQERVEQHPALARLHPRSLNTIRLITALADGARRAVPFAAILRVGSGGSVVDNLSASGLVIRVDLEANTLRGEGMRVVSGGERFEAHPDTGVRFANYSLPFFGEGVEYACQLHREIGKLRTVGWDLAITPEGPSVIEGNTHWGSRGLSASETNFKSRVLALYA